MNNANFDQMLCDALLEANRLDDQDVGEESVPVVWSSHYQRQRRKMLNDPFRWYRNRVMPIWKKVGRTVASILLVIMISFSAVLAVSPTARAQFFAWVQEIYETHIVYRFFGEAAAGELPQYKITALPDGYREVDRFSLLGQIGITYENDRGDSIYFDYVWIAQGTAVSILLEDMDREDTVVNGWEGHYYVSRVSNHSNALVWMDLEKNIQYTIDAYANKSTLLQYAQTIALKK